MAEEPRCIEVNVTRSAGGQVALKDYGKHNSNWFISFGRKYQIPEDWTDAQVNEFQLAMHEYLEEQIDPLDEAAFEARARQSQAEGY